MGIIFYVQKPIIPNKLQKEIDKKEKLKNGMGKG